MCYRRWQPERLALPTATFAQHTAAQRGPTDRRLCGARRGHESQGAPPIDGPERGSSGELDAGSPRRSCSTAGCRAAAHARRRAWHSLTPSSPPPRNSRRPPHQPPPPRRSPQVVRARRPHAPGEASSRGCARRRLQTDRQLSIPTCETASGRAKRRPLQQRRPLQAQQAQRAQRAQQAQQAQREDEQQLQRLLPDLYARCPQVQQVQQVQAQEAQEAQQAQQAQREREGSRGGMMR